MTARLSDAQLRALLRDLAGVEADPHSPEVRELLHRAFGVRVPMVLVRAATAVREARLEGFTEILLATYERSFEEPWKRDPGCLVKTAVMEALDFAEHEDAEPFLRGITYRQLEKDPGGPPVDTAGALRARCGFALVRLHHQDTLTHLTDLLVDGSSIAREAAAQALAYHGDPYGAALLRLKLHYPESDSDVIIECLKAYLDLDPEQALPRAAQMLDTGREDLRQGTALALGESRRPAALPLLEHYVASSTSERDARVGLMSIGTLRLDEGQAFLLHMLRTSDGDRALAALEALSVFVRDDETIRAVASAATANPDTDLDAALRQAFPQLDEAPDKT